MIAADNQSLVKVHLYGALAERYGAEHAFAIRSPREAVWALDANHPGFLKDFLKNDRYVIMGDGALRDGDEALLNVAEEVHFFPKVEGEAFLFVPLLGAIGITGTAATIISGLLFAGVLVGLSFLLKPKQPDKPKTPDEKKDESFAFSGPENTTQQGVAVPVIYGRVFAGSVVISAGLDVADVPIT